MILKKDRDSRNSTMKKKIFTSFNEIRHVSLETRILKMQTQMCVLNKTRQ